MHYHIGHRQPGFDYVYDEIMEDHNTALEAARVAAQEALDGLDGAWVIDSDDLGGYFVTLVRDGKDVFSWHYYVEDCEEVH